MGPEFEALRLIRAEQADNRYRFAQGQIAAVRRQRQRQKPYRFVGRDADSGNAVIEQDGQVVSAGQITSSATIKVGQAVRVLMAPGQITVKQLPVRIEPKREKRVQPSSWPILYLCLVQRGNDLVFYLCGHRPTAQKVYVWKSYYNLDADGQALSIDYSLMAAHSVGCMFSPRFENLGANQWLLTFGYSEFVSNNGDTFTRRNTLYRLDSRGLKTFFSESVEQDYYSREDRPTYSYHYVNLGNGYFSRQKLTTTITRLAGGNVVKTDLKEFDLLNDQKLRYTQGQEIRTDITRFSTDSTTIGYFDVLPGMRVDYAYGRNAAYQVSGLGYDQARLINRRGTGAIGTGQTVVDGSFNFPEFAYTTKGISISKLNPTTWDYEPVLYDNWEFVSLLDQSIALLPDLNANLNPSDSTPDKDDLFAESGRKKKTTVKIFGYDQQQKQAMKVNFYQIRRPFQSTGATGDLLWVSNVSYHG